MIVVIASWPRMKMDRRAVAALEYGLIAGIIVGSVLVGFAQLANGVSTKFSSVGGHL
jgi:Flp pilus assembly pilin Flp